MKPFRVEGEFEAEGIDHALEILARHFYRVVNTPDATEVDGPITISVWATDTDQDRPTAP